MNDSLDDVLRISNLPHLDQGTLVVAFSDWMDGGDVLTGTVRRLVELTTAQPVRLSRSGGVQRIYADPCRARSCKGANGSSFGRAKFPAAVERTKRESTRFGVGPLR